MATFTGNAAGYRVDVVDGQIRVVDIDSSNGDTGTQIIDSDTTLTFTDRSYTLAAHKGVPIEVPTDTQNAFQQITNLAGGGYLLTWGATGLDDGNTYMLNAQRYDAAGNKLGEASALGHSISYSGEDQYDVTALADGGYVLTWHSMSASPDWWDVFAQPYDALGNPVGGETRVSTHTEDDQFSSSVAGLSDGGYVISWVSAGQDGSGSGIYAQRFDANGDAVGEETRVNTKTAGDQGMPQIAALENGGYTIAWESYSTDGDDSTIRFQCFDADGHAVRKELRVDGSNAGVQEQASITALKGGGFVITWENYNDNQTITTAQRFDDSGHKLGPKVKVDVQETPFRSHTVVEALADGGYVIAWENMESGATIFAQRYDHTGHKVGDQVTVADDGYNPRIAGLDDGSFTVTWTQWNAFQASEVFSRHFDADGGSDTITGVVIFGSAKSDVMNGGAGVQRLYGGEGGDTMNGGDGADSLFGGVGQDKMHGNAGDDYLSGSAGHNVMYGDEGNDVLLGANGGDDMYGGAGNDILQAGEFGVGKMFGGSGDDQLFGGDRNDLLNGGEGADVLTGGIDRDIFRFDSALSAGNVDLIADFEGPSWHVGDRIELDNAVFSQLNVTGKLSADFFAANASGQALDANDYVVYNTTTGELFYDADGNGAGAKIEFAVVGTSTHFALDATDFHVI